MIISCIFDPYIKAMNPMSTNFLPSKAHIQILILQKPWNLTCQNTTIKPYIFVKNDDVTEKFPPLFTALKKKKCVGCISKTGPKNDWKIEKKKYENFPEKSKLQKKAYVFLICNF